VSIDASGRRSNFEAGSGNLGNDQSTPINGDREPIFVVCRRVTTSTRKQQK